MVRWVTPLLSSCPADSPTLSSEPTAGLPMIVDSLFDEVRVASLDRSHEGDTSARSKASAMSASGACVHLGLLIASRAPAQIVLHCTHGVVMADTITAQCSWRVAVMDGTITVAHLLKTASRPCRRFHRG